ncbi:MAG TPA: hypothetical protein PLK95_04950 [Pseudothermotoga sp.]|nr:hypothetical protein [Pseudothermotoga sp.]
MKLIYALSIAGVFLLVVSLLAFRKSSEELSKTSIFLILLCILLFSLSVLLSFLKGG